MSVDRPVDGCRCRVLDCRHFLNRVEEAQIHVSRPLSYASMLVSRIWTEIDAWDAHLRSRSESSEALTHVVSAGDFDSSLDYEYWSIAVRQDNIWTVVCQHSRQIARRMSPARERLQGSARKLGMKALEPCPFVDRIVINCVCGHAAQLPNCDQ